MVVEYFPYLVEVVVVSLLVELEVRQSLEEEVEHQNLEEQEELQLYLSEKLPRITSWRGRWGNNWGT